VFQIGEMAQWILSFLDPVEDMPVARFVCRQWNAAIVDWLSRWLSPPLPSPSLSLFGSSSSSSSSPSFRCTLSLVRDRQSFGQQKECLSDMFQGRRSLRSDQQHQQQPAKQQDRQQPPQATQPLCCESSFDMGYLASCHAFRNRLSVLQWIRFDAGWHWDCRTCTEAVRGGHFRVLAWAVANGCLWDGHKVCHEALRSGRLCMARWARAHGAGWGMRASREAVIGGRLAVLQWTRAHGRDWHEVAWTLLFSHHRQDMIRWALANGCPWPDSHSSGQINSAKSERIRVNRWAHAHGFRWRHVWLEFNAGCFDAVKWRHANGFRMGSSTCLTAACFGHLDMLKWARQKGCPWNGRVFLYAILSGRLDIIQWAYANGCTWSSSMGDVLIGNADTMDVVRWLRQNGATFTTYSCSGIAGNCPAERRIALLRWVRVHGGLWNQIVCVAGARSGHLALVQWAYAHGCPCGVDVWKSVVRNGQWHVLAWAMSRADCVFSTTTRTTTTDYREEVEMVLCAAACGAVDALAWMHQRMSLEALDLLYNPMFEPCGEDASHGSLRDLCNVAAANGHLAIIRWARERNYPWYESTCHAAAKHDHVSVLAWLRANGCPWNEAECHGTSVMMACNNVVNWIINNRNANTSSSRDCSFD